MADSEAQICNLALRRIGIGQTIGDLTEPSAAAAACADLYPLMRDEVLQDFPWPFAVKRATLALLDEARNGWAFVYSLPDDIIQPLKLIPPGTPTAAVLWNSLDYGAPLNARTPLQLQRYPFAIEGAANLTGSVLCTDIEQAELLYVARVTSPLAFPPLFTGALAWRLAQELAMPLMVKPELAIAAGKAYQSALQRAGAAAFRGQTDDLEPESAILQSRY